jgi:hypothetical protein
VVGTQVHPARRGVLSAAIAGLIVAVLPACSFMLRDSFTAAQESIAQISGMPGVRIWADASAAELRRWFKDDSPKAIGETGRFDVLAISGGAYDGAYGAGIINGWTAAGNRPKFTVVTGVSAGALLAPFAFLGPDYDPLVESAFTSGVAQVLGSGGGILSLLGTPDLRRQSLSDLVDRYVDRRMLNAIAVEHARGRRLLIVTTNLDAQRAVLWDMGAIAASGSPDSLRLFKDVLIASASIPGVFAPTYVEVEANGRRFREMHVDGGAITEVFIIPDALLISGIKSAALHGSGKAHIWAIINNHLTPEFEVVEAGLLSTVSRSFSTLIKSSTRTTLLATAGYTGKQAFNLTYIDSGFDDLLKRYRGQIEPGFNAEYMRTLYRYAYEKARSPIAWTHETPLPGQSPAGSREIAHRQ